MTNAQEKPDPKSLPTPATIHIPDGTWVLSVVDAGGNRQDVTVQGPGPATISIQI